MTREEACNILHNGLVNAPSEHDWCMAFKMAIKALEQEPCDDAVSRQDTLAEFKRVYFDDKTVIRCAELILGSMPSVLPKRERR